MGFARNLVSVLIPIAGASFVICARAQSESPPGATHATATAEAFAHCSLRRESDRFVGGCGKLFGQKPEMTLRSAPHIATGVWRDDIQPVSVWAGDMTDKGYPNAPLELEIYTGDWGILRTAYGWFAVSKFRSSTAIGFDLDNSREIQPNSLDGKIIRTAAGILSTEGAWNRKDNRKCAATATTWSIYCAMEKAIVDVTGGFHHRRPAMEVVREIIDERTARRNYHHRLMDYNNDPTTHLSDVQTLFKEALERMKKLDQPRFSGQ